MEHTPLENDQLISHDASVELSANRTGLSLERTRMSADRTLMATVRTSLSMIGFGFSLHSLFRDASARATAADRAGSLLLVLGLLILAAGIAAHVIFGRELTRRREQLYEARLLHHPETYRATPTLIIAGLLLITGLYALGSVTSRLT